MLAPETCPFVENRLEANGSLSQWSILKCKTTAKMDQLSAGFTKYLALFLALGAMLTTSSACEMAPAAEVKGESMSPQAAEGPAARAAKMDLAKRIGVDEDKIKVVRYEEVTWRDGSLGCPRPGMAYTQALVNGTLIELEASGRLYRYHSGGRRPPFLCENPSDPLPPSSSGGGRGDR
ncbi:MAG: hypothetical protein HY695_28215 [Deltaproteobacteria bacterium]|nr:hypothetical protein [Deltaproteobacteria bacterium]